jgi:AcrR family transcriptional regulator
MRRAMLELLEARSLDRISIKDVTLTARVSYPTFFRNYTSKTDLLGDIAAEEVQQLIALMLSYVDRSDLQGNAEGICRYVEEHRRLWTVLLNTGASPIMRDEFIKAGMASVEDRGRINPGLPLDMVSAFVAGGLFEILAWWLRQPEDYPAGRIAAFLKLLVLEPTVVPHDV